MSLFIVGIKSNNKIYANIFQVAKYNFINITLSFNIEKVKKGNKRNIYNTEIPLYGWRTASMDDWKKYEVYLNEKDWYTEAQYLCISAKLDLLYWSIEDAMDLSFKLKETKINGKIIPNFMKKVV